LTPRSYPKRLAHHYLEAMRDAFVNFMQRAHGAGTWERKVAIVARPYAFIKFDKTIQRMRKDYQNPKSRDNLAKLNDELTEIRHIMNQNIQDVLDRGEKLDHVQQQSERLVNQSKDFKWGAKKLNLMALYRQYAPFAAIGLVLLVVVYVKFFW
jgi:vesicle transport protein SEC22